jgi:hypothetical protein
LDDGDGRLKVSFEEGLTEERVSGETIRATLLARIGVRWQRAKRWITSPDPLYARKKKARWADAAGGGKVDRVVGFLDECWWSRVAQPNLHGFSEEDEPLRLLEQRVEKDDPEPKAISCYGPYAPELGRTWLRFVDGRPVGGITTRFLECGA